ncbi:flagellar biosynthetic protein FliO [Nocardioides zeae]
MIELVIRLVFSLAVVVGLLLLCARVAQRRTGGRRGDLVTVVQRQALSRSSTVTVVTVGSRVLVLGTTEQQVSVLAELDPEEVAGGLDGNEGLDGHDDLGPDPVDAPSVLSGSTSHLRLLRDAGTGTVPGTTLVPPTVAGVPSEPVQSTASWLAAALAASADATPVTPAVPAAPAAPAAPAGEYVGRRRALPQAPAAPATPVGPATPVAGKRRAAVAVEVPVAVPVAVPAPAPATTPVAVPAPAVAPDRPTRGGSRRTARPAARPAAGGALSGSILSPSTWRAAYAAVARRAS